MRSLLLTGPSPERSGGVATAVRQLLEWLPESPWSDWSYFATDKGGSALPGPIARLTSGVDVAASLRETLAATQPNLLHVSCGSDASGWGLREGLLHAELGRRAGAAVLLHLHASALEELLSPFSRESRLFLKGLRRVSAIAAPAQASLALLEDRGIAASRLFHVPNCVPVTDWKPPPAASSDKLRLCFVGSIEPRKGIAVLIEALRRVNQGAQRVEVLAFGPQACPDDIFACWQDKGKALGLRLMGALPPSDVAEAIRASDGLVLPSLAECQPYSLLEAMAACRPVLATSSGGVSSLLRDGAGQLVQPGDPADLARALTRWCDAPEERLSLARRGWERVQEGHSIGIGRQSFVRAWEGALEEQERT